MKNLLTRGVDVLDRGLATLLVGLLATMVVVVSWQVATRYLLDSPSSITEELATHLLIWISLLGAVHALRRGAHIGVDILERRAQGRRKYLVKAVTQGVVFLFALVVLVYGGARLVYVTLALEQVSAALQIPMGYVYAVIPLSGVLMMVYAVEALLTDEASTPERDASSHETAPGADAQQAHRQEATPNSEGSS